jgi:tetratricopeptide (TPR) repeat protein
MCSACQRGGPHVPPHQLRWLLRGEALPRSLLSLEQIGDLIEEGKVDDDVLVAREGGGFRRLHEHPDFRGLFLPGSVADRERRAHATATAQEAAAGRRRLALRRAAAVALAAASVAFAAYSTANGLFVLSSETTEGLSEQVSRAVERVSAPVDPTIVALPELALLETLPDPASIKEGLPALMYQGQRGLWMGTEAGLAEARTNFERAVSLAPLDSEALASLAEVYARSLGSDPSLLNPMTGLISRSQMIADGTVAVLRARAAAELAEGRPEAAAALVASCGAPVEQVLSGVDVGCALLLAEAQQDTAALSVLRERFPGVGGIDLATARVALAGEDWATALEWGAAITRAHPRDAAGWSTQLVAAAAVGEWRAATAAGEQLIALGSDDLSGLHRHAQILLQVYDKPGPAAKTLDLIVAHPSFENYLRADVVFTDAAAAAAAEERWEDAAAHAAAALERDAPAARVQLAWARLQLGDSVGALEVISGMDAVGVGGDAEARRHLGAARVHLALDDQRGAETELGLALQADPALLAAHVERAASKVSVSDLNGAIEALEDAAFSESILPTRQLRLEQTWLPPADTGRMQTAMEEGLRRDARFAVREAELRALLAWAAGGRSATELLRGASQRSSSGAISAALGQQLVAAGRCDEALPRLERALGARPNAPTMLAMLSYCMATQGDPGARQLLDQVMLKDNSSQSILYWSSMALEVMDDDEGAVAAWSDYLRAYPGDVLGREALMRLKGD